MCYWVIHWVSGCFLTGLDFRCMPVCVQGGYLAAAYALEYPDQVRHLILADPWGFPAKPPDNQLTFHVPAWVKVAAKVMSAFNPLATLRAFGPLGKCLV